MLKRLLLPWIIACIFGIGAIILAYLRFDKPVFPTGAISTTSTDNFYIELGKVYEKALKNLVCPQLNFDNDKVLMGDRIIGTIYQWRDEANTRIAEWEAKNKK